MLPIRIEYTPDCDDFVMFFPAFLPIATILSAPLGVVSASIPIAVLFCPIPEPVPAFKPIKRLFLLSDFKPILPLINSVKELSTENKQLKDKLNDLEIFIKDKLGDE